MKPHRLRSLLITAVLALATGAAWLYLAPTSLGGSTTYVTTSGISMEPRFHSGDLALVRPASHYRVGQIVAYRSSLLHVTVLHRIIAIHDGRYAFRGDNNDFVDPVHPTRSELIGALWIHVPHGGTVIKVLHTPAMGAVLAALAGLVLLAGAGQRRRRRGRRRNAHAPRPRGGAPVKPRDPDLAGPPNLRTFAAISGAVALVFLILALFAFDRPADRPMPHTTKYTQRVSFSYHAGAPVGPVYPSGQVSTGDPVFLQLVHQLAVGIAYRLATPALTVLHGTDQVRLELTGPTGWTRSIRLSSGRFTGDHFRAGASLDLGSLQSLLAAVQRQTGVVASDYTIAIAASVHVHGLVAGQPVNTGYTPQMSFTLQPLQLQPGNSAAGSSGSSGGGFHQSQSGAVTTASTAPNVITILGVSVGLAALRLLAPVAFVIALTCSVLLTVLVLRGRAFGESARIQARYGHLIVPINGGSDLGWPAIDVGDIKALARLAEVSGQLILHSHEETADTYLVNDEGSVYRYQVQLPKVVWGDWTAPTSELPV